MGALFGVLLLPVLYIFAKRLFKRTLWASVATAVFAADFMHYTLTRIATIDSYSLCFILLMYYFMYEYTQHSFNKEKLWRTLLPLGLCGASFALGAATKWLCLYAGAGLAVTFFYTVYQRKQEYNVAREQGMEAVTRTFKKKLTLTLLFCVLVFIVIPVLVYIVSYIPYANAREGYGLADIWRNQEYMLNYHGNLDPSHPHPYQSSCYTWPFNLRPVYFYAGDNVPAGMASVIWCFANPLITIPALGCVVFLLGLRGKRKINLKGVPFIAIAALSQYLPWVIITREVFIYHYFATIPFLIFAMVYVWRYLWQHYKWAKYALPAYLVLLAISFVAFYPVTTGTLVSRAWASAVRWLPLWPL